MELINEFLKLESIKKIQEDKFNNKNIESYLFFSPDSLTNKNYAIAVSMSFICKNGGCKICPDCLKIIEGVHPDVLVFPEGKTLAVSDSKKIVEESTKKPMLADKKVIIINDINNSSDEAQNKLLKIIEEPPKNVIFVATATNMDKVLPTIKSRMQKRQIERFSKQKIQQILSDVSSQKLELAISHGEGYIGKTLNILSNEQYFANFSKAKDMVFKIKSSSQILENLTEKIISRDNLREILENMSNIYRDILISKGGCFDALTNSMLAIDYKNVESEYSMIALVEIQKLITNAIKKIQANCSTNLILETLLVKILEVKYLCK